LTNPVNFDHFNDQLRPNFVLNIWLIFSYCGQQNPSSIQMWPLDGFEFETSALVANLVAAFGVWLPVVRFFCWPNQVSISPTFCAELFHMKVF
jgi:hypothetical protein